MSKSPSPRSSVGESDTTSSVSRRGITCRRCDRRLPIALAQADERAALWICSACGAQFAGVLLADSDSEAFARITLDNEHFDAHNMPPIPGVIRQLVTELARSEAPHAGAERRQAMRVLKQLEASLIPLDQQLALLGLPRRAMVYNLSESGLSVMLSETVAAPHLALRIPVAGEFLQVIGRIVRCRQLRPAIHEVGVELIHRLGRRAKS